MAEWRLDIGMARLVLEYGGTGGIEEDMPDCGQ